MVNFISATVEARKQSNKILQIMRGDSQLRTLFKSESKILPDKDLRDYHSQTLSVWTTEEGSWAQKIIWNTKIIGRKASRKIYGWI